jgi:hypothetical protein
LQQYTISSTALMQRVLQHAVSKQCNDEGDEGTAVSQPWQHQSRQPPLRKAAIMHGNLRGNASGTQDFGAIAVEVSGLHRKAASLNRKAALVYL